jgi:beta-phosphoglucomutase-like phosphatase (HAD superfamily)
LIRRLLVGTGAAAGQMEALLAQWRMETLRASFHRFACRAGVYRGPEDFVPAPGGLEALRRLAQDYPLALVTGRGSHEATAFLAQFDLPPLVRAVVTRDDVHRLKPHPAAIKLAARRLGVPIQNLVAVMSTEADVRAAKAAGAIVVGVAGDGLGQADLHAADLVIPAVSELRRWLARDGRER